MGARPTLRRLLEGPWEMFYGAEKDESLPSISAALIDKVRWGQRRPTDRAMMALTAAVDMHARKLIFDARKLRAVTKHQATDLVEMMCAGTGKVLVVSLNVEAVLGRPPMEVCNHSFEELFAVAPELKDSETEQAVMLRRADGSVEHAFAVITPLWRPPNIEQLWHLAVLLRDPDGPRSEPNQSFVAAHKLDLE